MFDDAMRCVETCMRARLWRCTLPSLESELSNEFEYEAVEMKIKVLGPGCSKCRTTIGIIERAARALNVEVEIIKIEDRDEIKRLGVSSTPAVVIDGKIVHSGGLPHTPKCKVG